MMIALSAPVAAQPLINGGGPIVATPIKVYLIYWLPTGEKFDTTASDGVGNFESLTTQFFSDVSTTSYFGIAAQYSSKIKNTAGAVRPAVTWVDTAPYNQFISKDVGTRKNPLQDTGNTKTSDIRQEIERAIKQNGWTVTASSIFMVFTGAHIEECQNGGCTYNTFCGYHNNFVDSRGATVLYAYLSDVNYNVDGCGEGLSSPINLQLSSDQQTAIMTHEFFETVTDPLFNAWLTSTGAEIGDLCNQKGRDVNLSGDWYWVQAQWSNAKTSCQPSATPALPVCSASTDCVGEFSISCSGPDVGVSFNGSCRNSSGAPQTCTAGSTGASTVTGGGNLVWLGSTTAPNTAQACTQKASVKSCVSVQASVPTGCPISTTSPVPDCGTGERWCTKFSPPHCARDSECTVIRNQVPP
jgi:hypothetical protein